MKSKSPELPLKSPLEISIRKITSIPYQWHDYLEIIIVLKGSIHIYAGTNNCFFSAGNVEIININEIHRLSGSSENNAVLTIKISTDFIRRFVPEINELMFNSILFPYHRVTTKQMAYLRRLCARFVLSVNCADVPITEQVKADINDILQYIKKHFDVVRQILKKKNIKGERYQANLERYRRINNFIYSNASRKLGLKEVAERENLSSYYLSHELKNLFSYGFQELLNHLRIQKAMKLLITSKLTLMDIAYECGYSAPRYLKQYFQLINGITPLNFRRAYSYQRKDYESIVRVENIDPESVLPIIRNYTHAKSDKLVSKLVNITIDQKTAQSLPFEIDKTVSLGETQTLNDPRVRELLKKAKNEAGLSLVRIPDFIRQLLADTTVSNLIDRQDKLTALFKNLDFLNQCGLKPWITIKPEYVQNNSLYLESLGCILQAVSDHYGREETKKWHFELPGSNRGEPGPCLPELQQLVSQYSRNLSRGKKSSNPAAFNHLHDTVYPASKLIHDIFQAGEHFPVASLSDLAGRSKLPLAGMPGLFTQDKLKKPCFFAYSILSRLKGRLIKKSKHYAVFKENDVYRIILFNHLPDEKLRHKQLQTAEDYKQLFLYADFNNLKVTLGFKNFYKQYKVVQHKLNEQNCSVFQKWLNLGQPARFSADEVKLLDNMIHPDIQFTSFKNGLNYFTTELPPYGIELIEITRLQTGYLR